MEISPTWVSTCRAKWAGCGCRRSSSSTPSRHASRTRRPIEEILLAESAEMVAYPYGNRFSYGRVLDAVDVERFQFSPDRRPGLIVQYLFKNSSDRARRLRLQWSVKTDLRPGWYADRLGIRDGQDVVEWRANEGVFVARDTDNPWFCVWGALSSTDARRIEHPPPIHTNGRGVTAASSHMVTVGAHSTATLTFVVSGSTTGESDAVCGLRLSVGAPCRAAGGEGGALWLDHQPGPLENPGPAPARGLQLEPDQHGVAGQGRSGHRPRSQRRLHGISVVVRNRDVLRCKRSRRPATSSWPSRRCACCGTSRTR